MKRILPALVTGLCLCAAASAAPPPGAGELGAPCCRSLFVTARGAVLVACVDPARRLCLMQWQTAQKRWAQPLVVGEQVTGRSGRRFALWQSPGDALYACYLKRSGDYHVYPSVRFRKLTPEGGAGGFRRSDESVVVAAGHSGGPQSVLSICRDGDGRLWAGWSRWDLYHTGALQVAHSADEGKIWSAPQTLRIGTGDSGSGFLSVIAPFGRPRAICMGLDFVPAFESRWNAGRWSKARWLSEFGKGGGRVGWGEGVNYSIVADDAGRIHVLSAYYGARVSHNVCQRDGTWRPFVPLETTGTQRIGGLSLTTDGQALWAVWSVGGKLRLSHLVPATDGGGAWSRPADVTIDAAGAIARPHLPARVDPGRGPVPLAFESAGRVRLTWLDLPRRGPAPGRPTEDMSNQGKKA